LFLEGRNRELITRLEKDMSAASEALNFERAAQIRDQIRAVGRTIERQDVVSPKMEDRDIIGVTRKEKRFQLVVLFVRKGYLLGSRGFRFRDGKATSPEIVEAFLKQYYTRERFIPKQILISEEVEDIGAITDFLSTLAGKKVSVHHPKKGEKKRLTDMAVTNAGNLLRARDREDGRGLMEQVRVGLNLVATPRVIEGLDISNIQGDLSVGTVVSFVDGLPNKAGYRNYKIRRVAGADDYAMMSQLASRRIAKGGLPDLFVVDGGKGHLMVVQRELAAFRNGQTPDLVALAKRDERRGEKTDKVYLPGRKNPVQLKEGHPVLFLLMRIRDEAHRRAIAYHRKLRSKKLKESVLDGILGVGPARKRRLLEHFGDVSQIARADFEALSGVPGISRETAAEILTFFQDI
jgi:excinuclease ABC subunit C